MKVKIAKSAGFCFGVKRAVDEVYKQIETNHKQLPIYTFGPIIHNKEVVKELSELGVKVIESVDELKSHKPGIIIIRSHGVTKDVCDAIASSGYTIQDATCPFVKKIHNIVEKASAQQRTVIVVGNPVHPEVEGILGWGTGKTIVVQNEEEAQKLHFDKHEKLTIVSQTTFNYKKFQNIVEIFDKKGYDINVENTICNATHVRQAEASEIAKEVEAMIVIGDKHSSNTQKLYEICKMECNNTYYIQTLDDLVLSELGDISYVGITAGASTPNNIIEEVHTNVREF